MMICTNCGREINEGMKFCVFCGTRVEPIIPASLVDEEYVEDEIIEERPQGESAWQTQEPSQGQNQAWQAQGQQPWQPVQNQNWQSQDRDQAWQSQPWQNQGQNQNWQNQTWQSQTQGQQPWQPVQNQSWQQTQGQSTWQNQGQNQAWQTGANQWQQDLEMENEEPEPKPKKSVLLPILIALFSIVIIGLIVAIIFVVFFKGSIGGKDKEPSSISREVEEEEEEEEADDNKGRHSKEEESEEESEAEPSDASETSDPQEESKEDTSSSETESSETSVAEPESVTLSCGAKIDLDAVSVDLSDYSVDSLEGIEKVTGLTSLTIKGGELSDLSPLVSLSKLSTLVINNVPVKSIEHLVMMPSLTYIDLRDTQITAVDVQTLQSVKPSMVIVGYTYSTYTVVKTSVSWSEAKTLCENVGGHLATITSKEEMDKIIPLLNESGLVYAWLGATSSSGTWEWVTGEKFEYTKWYGKEPSGKDQDGTIEDCLCIWYLEKDWTENDQRNNLPDILGSSKSNLGYVLEIESVSGIKPAD